MREREEKRAKEKKFAVKGEKSERGMSISQHWVVRTSTGIAILFKAVTIIFSLMAVTLVVLLSTLGVIMSWALLPWALAYLYFMWWRPAHHLEQGLRKLDQTRMVLWMASTGFHVVPFLMCLFSSSPLTAYLHLRMGVTCTLLALPSLLLVSEVFVGYAYFVITAEKQRLKSCIQDVDTVAALASRTELGALRSKRHPGPLSPPPSYRECCLTSQSNPPRYEEIFLTV